MKKILALMALVGAMVSCTEEMTIKTDDADPKLVIFGCLSDRYEPFKITVGKSCPYFSKDKNLMVDDAEVEITSSNEERWALQSKGKGIYMTPDSLQAEEGVTYNLRVAYDFDQDGKDEIYSAQTTMLRRPALDSMDVSYVTFMGNHNYAIHLYFQELEGDDSYLYKIYVNDTLKTDKLSEWCIEEDGMYDGQYISASYYDIPDVKEISEYEDQDDFDDMFFVGVGDKVTVEFGTIEEGYRDFVDQCIFEQNGENVFFSSTPADIDTNLDNGAIGYFGSWNRQTLSVVIK